MSISNVTITVMRDKHWRSAGVYVNGDADGYINSICNVTIKNNNSVPVYITSITLPVGTGKTYTDKNKYTTLYGQYNKGYSKFYATGANCTGKIIDYSGNKLFTANVSTIVTVRASGSTSSSGYFWNPTCGTVFTGSLTLSAGSSIKLGVGLDTGSGSLYGPILSCDNGMDKDNDGDDKKISRYVDINGEIKCAVSNYQLTSYTILGGYSTATTASCSATPSDATVEYNWYNSSGTWLASGATRVPTSDKEYCTVTVSKPGWTPASVKVGTITYYTRVANPAQDTLKIKDSKVDGRTTNREDYTFEWGSGVNGINNKVNNYSVIIYKDGQEIKNISTTNNSIKYTAAELALVKGNKLKFSIKTTGEKYDADSSISSGEVTIVSSAVVHVYNSGWHEGIAYINTGTIEKPNWVEATEVWVNDNGWHIST